VAPEPPGQLHGEWSQPVWAEQQPMEVEPQVAMLAGFQPEVPSLGVEHPNQVLR